MLSLRYVREFQMYFHDWRPFFILILIALKFVTNVPIDIHSALIEVMAWRRTGDKPLSEPMLTQFIDAYECGTVGRWVKQPM